MTAGPRHIEGRYVAEREEAIVAYCDTINQFDYVIELSKVIAGPIRSWSA